MSKPTLIVLGSLRKSIQQSAEKIIASGKHPDLQLAVMSDKPAAEHDATFPVQWVQVDWNDPESIATGVQKIEGEIAAVVCRGEGTVQQYRLLIPHLPAGVPTPTPRSLEIATDKGLMRAAFTKAYPQITPKFMYADSADEDSLEKIVENVGFPLIIKPSNLASSMLIQRCNTMAELKENLNNVLAAIGDIYLREHRIGAPTVIVEQFMTGKLFSVDACINEIGHALFLPPVSYESAQDIGVDDFFLYKRWLPAELSNEEIASLEEACRQAIEAVGLRMSTAHIELMYTNEGWKIIELGPRQGRFRREMYELAYGIDYSTDELLLLLGDTPKIAILHKSYCAAYSIYAYTPGTLQEISGWKELRTHTAVNSANRKMKTGDVLALARDGGAAAADIIVAHADNKTYQEAVDFIEAHVRAVTT